MVLKSSSSSSRRRRRRRRSSSSSSSTTTLCVVVIIFFFYLRPTLSILDPKEYLALQSIRKSLSDLPGSAFFSSWDFTADPCAAFSGVTCSADRVVSLSLGDPRAGSPGLTGRLSPSLGRLPSLLHLALVPGRVYGPIPPSLSRCSALRFLALSRNFLSGPIPPSFSRLRCLKTLDLSFNLLTAAIPPPAGLLSLSNLILSHNHLSGPIPPLPPSLVRLDLHRNNLTGAVPGLPRSLRYLSLSTNRLTGGASFLRPLSALNYLDLSFNMFTGPVPASLFSLPISDLYLQRNYFSGRLWVRGPVRMEAVDLSYNRLGGTLPPELAEAERVYLNSNRFVGDVPGRFAERVMAGRIRVLYLQHNYLTGLGGLAGRGREVPRTVSLCVQYNCVAPPPGMVCPARAGSWRRRPPGECRQWWNKG